MDWLLDPGNDRSEGVGRDARAAVRSGRGARGASRQGGQHPRHGVRDLTALTEPSASCARIAANQTNAKVVYEFMPFDVNVHSIESALAVVRARAPPTAASRSTPGTCPSSASRPTTCGRSARVPALDRALRRAFEDMPDLIDEIISTAAARRGGVRHPGYITAARHGYGAVGCRGALRGTPQHVDRGHLPAGFRDDRSPVFPQIGPDRDKSLKGPLSRPSTRGALTMATRDGSSDRRRPSVGGRKKRASTATGSSGCPPDAADPRVRGAGQAHVPGPPGCDPSATRTLPTAPRRRSSAR